MEVEYELTPEDLKALNRHHQKNPIVPPRGRFTGVVVWIVCIVGVAGFLTLRRLFFLPELDLFLNMAPGVGLGMLLALVGIFLFLRLMQPNATRKVLQEGRNAEKALGWRRLTIDPHAVRTTSAFSASSFYWEGVEAVSVSQDHVFIYVTTRVAYVVPRRAFPDDRAFEDFVEMARRYYRMGGVAQGAPEGDDRPWERRPPPRATQRQAGAGDDGMTQQPRGDNA
jgi:hypothetical protein